MSRVNLRLLSVVGSGYIGSTLLLVNITLGAGMFNLPYALVKSGGIVSSFVVQAVRLFYLFTNTHTHTRVLADIWKQGVQIEVS